MDAAARAGERIGAYTLIAPLGSGGQGDVFHARGPKGDVALKLLHRSSDDESSSATGSGEGASADLAAWAREANARHSKPTAQREIGAARTLRSPYVARLLDVGEEPPFLAYELLHGETLAEWMTRDGTGALGDALAYGEGVLRALGDLHAAGVIHRDIKPSNVFLPSETTRPRVMLIDLGIAKSRTRVVQTKSGVRMGTPRFAAPEQLQDAKWVTERSDVYGAGLLLYRLLSGTFPFDVSTQERALLSAVRMARTPLRDVAPHLPQRLCSVVDRAVRCDPQSRFESALAFLAALRSVHQSPEWTKVSEASLPTHRSM